MFKSLDHIVIAIGMNATMTQAKKLIQVVPNDNKRNYASSIPTQQ